MNAEMIVQKGTSCPSCGHTFTTLEDHIWATEQEPFTLTLNAYSPSLQVFKSVRMKEAWALTDPSLGPRIIDTLIYKVSKSLAKHAVGEDDPNLIRNRQKDILDFWMLRSGGNA